MNAIPTIDFNKPLGNCIFCLQSNVPFLRVEHAISESLGGDILIPRGWVCDGCNQYFGSKIESKVLSWPPFSVERAIAAVPTKRRKPAIHQDDGFAFMATGLRSALFVVDQGNREGAMRALRAPLYVPKIAVDYDDVLARFFLKMGLELMLYQGVDVTDRRFDLARRCARYGELARDWDVSYGIYPDRDALFVSRRWDEIGALDTHQIYQWEMGIMEGGDIVLNFVYANHVFACNLSRPPNTEYLLGFNMRNSFTLTSRWDYKPSRK